MSRNRPPRTVEPTPIAGALYYDEAACWFYMKVGDVYVPVLPKRGYHALSGRVRKLFLEEFTRREP